MIHHLERPFLGNAGPALRGVTLREHFVNAGDPLPKLDEIDALIALGGEQSATDPALEPEAELLREAAEREVPVLGVCLGAQLLALALGGTVARQPRRLLAWTPLRALAEDPVLGALPPGAHGLHWNQDGCEPPPGAVELLERPDGCAEGFRAGRAWGIQFHPDIDAEALEHWYAAWPGALRQAGVGEEQARAADARHLPAQPALAQAIFGGFVGTIGR